MSGASLAIAALLIVTGCRRDERPTRHDAAPAVTPGTRVRDTAPPAVDPARLLARLHAARPDAPLFSVDDRIEPASSLQHAERVFLRTFTAQGLAAPPEDRVAEYLHAVLGERIRTAAVRARAERAGITAPEAEVVALADELRSHLAAQHADLVPSDADLRARATETILVDRLIAPDLEPVTAELEAWLRAHRAELTFTNAARIVEVRILAGGDRAASRVRADQLRVDLASLDDGEFAERATRDSEVPALAQPRWIATAGLPPEVATAIAATAPGGTTAVIDGPPGFAIIRVLRKEARVEPPLDEVRAEALAGWRAEHRDKVLRAHYTEAVAAHDVRLHVR